MHDYWNLYSSKERKLSNEVKQAQSEELVQRVNDDVDRIVDEDEYDNSLQYVKMNVIEQ